MEHLQLNIKEKIKLYDYQKSAFAQIIKALKTTFRALMVMATGLGKTILSIEVVKYFITPKDRVLFLCHDNGILNKTYKDYRKYIGNSFTYSKFYGDEKNWEADNHNFVFATFKSISVHLHDKKAKQKLFSPKHFSFVVVDESHHSQAETYAEVINYFKPKYKMGMTATPDRADETDIRDIFGNEVVDIRLPEAIANGWLTPIDYKVLSDGLDEEKISQVCEDVLIKNVRITKNQINEKVFIKVRSKEQCKIIEDYSRGEKAIVFCENINHLEHVASMLPSSVILHSNQSDRINEHNFHLFENGHVRHAIVVNKFNEGIDVPDTSLIVFLRVTDSERIFLQQLGRGLRIVRGKKKVIVLDFVANIDRIQQILSLTESIEKQFRKTEEFERKEYDTEKYHVSGKGFKFDFSRHTVNLLSALEKAQQDFYPTWQEASFGVKKLGIKSSPEYIKRYREDSKLPSRPDETYRNFPGWSMFLLGFEKYPTWQKASKAVRNLKISGFDQYRKRYKEDPRLLSNPNESYKNFPRWPIFFGKCDKFKTVKEAIEATKVLGIKEVGEYRNRYDEDPRLPKYPNKEYSDFPGWIVFLGKVKREKKECYKTWQEASESVKKLGIRTVQNEIDGYRKNYKKDPKLPSKPNEYYKNFPGWKVFCGRIFNKPTSRITNSYKTWQEAAEASKMLGIKSRDSLKNGYRNKHKEDSKLPFNPDRFYKDFPGWSKFLGKK